MRQGKKRATWMEGKGQNAGMRNVARGGHRGRPSLVPFAASPSTPDCGTLCRLSPKGALSAPASPWRALQNPGRARVVRALGTPRCTQVRSKRLEKEFGVSPRATQDGTCPLGGGALPWSLRGHAGRALPDPRTPLPLSPAWLWFSASPDLHQARKYLEFGPASSSQPQHLVFRGHWRPLRTDLRPSPAPPARSWSGLNR